MSFRENLQNLRTSKKMTQEELAEKLEVSRQAVSKWESGNGYPETDKIIAICEIFDCSMDTLIKGKISFDVTNERNEYDTFYNKFSKGISIAVGIILLGVTIMMFLSGYQNDKMDNISLVVLLLFVLFAVPIFIYFGISNDNFKKMNPTISSIYTDEEIKSYNNKFVFYIITGVTLIIFGVVILTTLYGFEIFDEESVYPVCILMLLIVIAVPLLIYAGIQKNKYDIDLYNNGYKESNYESVKGKISGIIMLIATFIFLALGFIFALWSIAWIVFPLGGILCGIVGIIFGKE